MADIQGISSVGEALREIADILDFSFEEEDVAVKQYNGEVQNQESIEALKALTSKMPQVLISYEGTEVEDYATGRFQTTDIISFSLYICVSTYVEDVYVSEISRNVYDGLLITQRCKSQIMRNGFPVFTGEPNHSYTTVKPVPTGDSLVYNDSQLLVIKTGFIFTASFDHASNSVEYIKKENVTPG